MQDIHGEKFMTSSSTRNQRYWCCSECASKTFINQNTVWENSNQMFERFVILFTVLVKEIPPTYKQEWRPVCQLTDVLVMACPKEYSTRSCMGNNRLCTQTVLLLVSLLFYIGQVKNKLLALHCCCCLLKQTNTFKLFASSSASYFTLIRAL